LYEDQSSLLHLLMGGIDLYTSSLVTAAVQRHGFPRVSDMSFKSAALTVVGRWVAAGSSGGSGVTGQCGHPVRLHGI